MNEFSFFKIKRKYNFINIFLVNCLMISFACCQIQETDTNQLQGILIIFLYIPLYIIELKFYIIIKK